LAGASGGAAMLGVRSDRPLWLLQAPQPLGRDGNRPWLDGPLALGAGCERIDTGWWDGQPVARDYYVAVTSEGERLWIYRDLRGAGGWFVHGIFGSRSRGPG
jgi:protein ImuB